MRFRTGVSLAIGATAATACMPAPTVTQFEMRGHFSQARGVYTSVVYGDLSLARESGRMLAEGEEEAGLPEGSGPHLASLRAAARSGARATTLGEAAIAAGRISGTCAACHRSYDVGPRLPRAGGPPGGESFGAHMARYRWALDRMWEGVVAPDEDRWEVGLETLREGLVDAEDLAARGGAEALAIARHLQELGSEGMRASGSAARAVLFGNALERCAECHQAARGW